MARVVSLLACVVAVAAGSTACGGDDTPAASTSPGRLFHGVYRVTTVARLPSTDDSATSATWTVQSSCTGPDNGCVAVATPTTPRSQPLQFVYEKGSWSRVTVPDARPCTPPGMAAPVTEPWVAIDSTTLAANGNQADLPLVTLTGTIRTVQGGSCSAITERAITLTREGNLPAGTAPIGKVSFPTAVASPGSGFTGTYDQRTTIVSADPPSLVPASATQTSQISATSTCTRDGVHCVVVMLDKPAQPGQTVAAYSDNGFDQTATLPERACPSGTGRYRPLLTSHTTIPAGTPNPIASMTGDSMLRWSGPCAGSVTFASTLTRTGD